MPPENGFHRNRNTVKAEAGVFRTCGRSTDGFGRKGPIGGQVDCLPCGAFFGHFFKFMIFGQFPGMNWLVFCYKNMLNLQIERELRLSELTK